MNLMSELIGWASSAVLLLTLMGQVRRQWQAHSVEGVSWVLFAGQILASVGFVTYSLLVGNTVFIVTNSLILATAITGQTIYLKRRREQDQDDPATDAGGAAAVPHQSTASLSSAAAPGARPGR